MLPKAPTASVSAVRTPSALAEALTRQVGPEEAELFLSAALDELGERFPATARAAERAAFARSRYLEDSGRI